MARAGGLISTPVQRAAWATSTAHIWLCGPASLRGMLDYFAGFDDVIRDPQACGLGAPGRMLNGRVCREPGQLVAYLLDLADEARGLPKTVGSRR